MAFKDTCREYCVNAAGRLTLFNDACRYCVDKAGRAAAGRFAVFGVGVCFSLLMAWLYIKDPTFLQYLDLKLYDALLLKRPQHETSGVPVIVDIDEHSLAQYGQWPWPRYRVALLIAKLQQAGVRAVGMDILFAEPDRTSPKVLQEQLKRDLKVDMGFTGMPQALMDNDSVLASVLKGGPFVLGYFFTFGDAGEAARDKADACRIHQLPFGLIKRPGTPQDLAFGDTASSVVCPLPVLGAAANGSGFFNTEPDIDGLLRRTPLFVNYQGRVYPNLSLATLMQALGLKNVKIQVDQDGVQSIKFDKYDTIIPLDAEGQMLINWRGPRETFRYVSASKVLDDLLDKDELKGKIVFIGTSAAGLKDLRATPYDAVYPGVEAHATVVDNVLKGDFIHRPTWAPAVEFFAIIVAGIITTGLLIWAKAGWSLVPVLASGYGMWWGAGFFLDARAAYISPLYSMITLGGNFGLLTLLKYWREEGQKKFLHATFQSYLAPELIDQMFTNKTMPKLGGEARVITAYFTDIQSFSTFSEKLTAVQLVELLNEYLTAMTDILLGDMGTLDKYEGDAIIAFIGAPLDVPDHGMRACRIAVAMQNKLLELREKWRNEQQLPGEPERNTKNLPTEEWAPGDKWPKVVHAMRMRIGVNSGEMVVGNMGSTMRMNYTMMGDAVNLAARLEAGAKQYGVFSMVSMFTMELKFGNEQGDIRSVADTVETRFIDNIQVVGKEEPVKVYELVAMKGGLTDLERELIQRFDTAMTLYLDQQWDQALAAFERAQEVERFPELKLTPSKVFMDRCRNYKDNPPVEPGAAWDGVYRMTKK